MELVKSSSILRKSSDILKPIRRVKFTKAVARHADIQDQGNLRGAAPTLQNLRIRLRKRQCGKSKVPAKQRGSWLRQMLCLVALSSSMSLFTVVPWGPFESNGKTVVPVIVWLGFHPIRPVQNHIGSGAGNPAHCYVRFGPRRWPSRLAHSQLLLLFFFVHLRWRLELMG